MRLIELDPRWTTHEKGRTGQGLVFLCPACRTHFIGIHFANPLDGGAPLHVPLGHPNPHRWERTGDTLDTITLLPCINTKCWYGFVTNGEITTI